MAMVPSDEDRLSAAVLAFVINPRRYRREHRKGFVYFVQCTVSGHVKIGYSQNPAQRLRKLDANAPAPLELLAIFSADREVESLLHAEFKHLRLHGEWFRPNDDLLRVMASLVWFSQTGEMPSEPTETTT
jgi:hypothetical protein